MLEKHEQQLQDDINIDVKLLNFLKILNLNEF